MSSQRPLSEQAAEARQLITDLHPKMHLVLQSDKYPLFLDVAARFHWYTYFNQFSIYFTYPDARYIAGYTVWKRISDETYNMPNRNVIKASERKNPIKLVAPFTIKNDLTQSRKLVYVCVLAFDVQQVEDLPAPENDFLRASQYSIEDLVNAINFVAPYRMCYAVRDDKNISCRIKGYCNHSLRQFIVADTLPPRSLAHVLLHLYAEAGVYLVGYCNEKLNQMVIESIFYVLLKHFDLSTESVTFSDIDKYQDTSQQDLAKAMNVIQSVSHRIIEKIDDQLECLVHFTPFTPFDDIDIMQGFDFDAV